MEGEIPLVLEVQVTQVVLVLLVEGGGRGRREARGWRRTNHI